MKNYRLELALGLVMGACLIAMAATVLTIPVSCRGRLPANVTATPASISFGDVECGTIADRTVILRNTGQKPLTGTVSVIAPCPTVSLVSGGALSLAPGASTTITIRFSPGPADTNAVSCRVAVSD